MKALWQIILAILWRLRPVQALEVNLRDIIGFGLAMFADDHELEALATDPAYSARIAAAMADAHRKLDLLIYLRACELAGITKRLGFKPQHAHTHSGTDLAALWRSFQRLMARFADYERLAAKRAERLRREQSDYPLRLAATLQSISPALCVMSATRQRLAALSPTTLMDSPAPATAAGGCASSRGPPPLPNPPIHPEPPRKPRFRDRTRTPMANPPLPATQNPGNVSRETSVRGVPRPFLTAAAARLLNMSLPAPPAVRALILSRPAARAVRRRTSAGLTNPKSPAPECFT